MSTEPSRGTNRSVVEVEFSIWDSEYPFVGASEAESCTFELAKMVPRGGGRYAEFFNVFGVSPDRIVEAAGAHETADVSLLTEYDGGGLFEFDVSGRCPAVRLAELGALPREVRSSDGAGRIVAEIPTENDASSIVEAFLEDISEAELACKRKKQTTTPLFTPSVFRRVFRSHLTARQRELLEAAFDAGYYDWPRECTGEEIAQSFDISSATFSEHIHAAERNLLTALFDGGNPSDSDRS